MKYMKTKELRRVTNSNMFALLRHFAGVNINDGNSRTSAARYRNFLITSGAPLNDAAGYPKNSGRVVVFAKVVAVAKPVQEKLGLG